MATYQCACTCPSDSKQSHQNPNLPLICMVPRESHDGRSHGQKPTKPQNTPSATYEDDFKLLDEATIKKHFKLPPRALYLDPFRRPLITFPKSADEINFSIDRKAKINQMILDGILDPSAAISAPSVFPYPTSSELKKKKEEDVDEELVYILQLPDWETRCPVHGDVIRTPRFIWHSCKKQAKGKKQSSIIGEEALKRPKPWLLSRITDFDMQSQW